jgi:hypothetical protein
MAIREPKVQKGASVQALTSHERPTTRTGHSIVDLKRPARRLRSLMRTRATGTVTRPSGTDASFVVACAGLPAGNMQIGGKTFFQYGATREVGTGSGVGSMLLLSRHATGCDATVTFQNDHVVQVSIRPYGGLLTGPLACGRLFATCHW